MNQREAYNPSSITHVHKTVRTPWMHHTWEESRAGGSRSEIWMETGGPVQLLWANMWRQETARAITASSLQQERQDTHWTQWAETLEGRADKWRYFKVFRIQKNIQWYWQMLTEVSRKAQWQQPFPAAASLCEQLEGFKNRHGPATCFAAFLLGWESDGRW